MVPVGGRNEAALLKEGASGDGITDIGDHDNLRNTGMVGETVLPRKIFPEIDLVILFPSLQGLIHFFGLALIWLNKCHGDQSRISTSARSIRSSRKMILSSLKSAIPWSDKRTILSSSKMPCSSIFSIM